MFNYFNKLTIKGKNEKKIIKLIASEAIVTKTKREANGMKPKRRTQNRLLNSGDARIELIDKNL